MTLVLMALLGTWNLGGYHFRAAHINISRELKIEQNQMTVNTYCTFGKEEVMASVTSPIKISGHYINVLQSSTQSKNSADNVPCLAEIEKQKMKFELNRDGSKITFSSLTGQFSALRSP